MSATTTSEAHTPREDQPEIPGADSPKTDDGTFPLTGDDKPAAEAKADPKATGKGGKNGKPKANGKPAPQVASTDALADKITANAAKKKTEGGKAAQAAEELQKQRAEEARKLDAQLAQQRARHTEALLSGWKPAPAVPVKLNSNKGDDQNALTFDKRLQMRALGKDIVDDDISTEYAQLMKDYDERYKDSPENERDPCRGFRPIKAIRITPEEAKEHGLPTCVVAIDGFHTGDAAIRNKYTDWPTEIQDGTWKYARLLAMSSNSTHGLTRTPRDKQKAFYALIEDQSMLADAVEIAKTGGSGREGGHGGLNRALALVAGISRSTVSEYLQAKGLTTRGDSIVTAPKKKDKPAEEATTTTPEATYTPAIPKLTEGQLSASSAVDLVDAVMRLQASLERHVKELLQRPDTAEIVIAAAAQTGHTVTVTELVEGDQTVYQCEWPVFTDLTMIFEAVQAQLQAAKVEANTEAAKADPTTEPAATA